MKNPAIIGPRKAPMPIKVHNTPSVALAEPKIWNSPSEKMIFDYNSALVNQTKISRCMPIFFGVVDLGQFLCSKYL